MVKINVSANTRELMAHITAEKGKVSRAQVRALNRTAEQLRTEAGREIRSVYNVTLRGIRQASKIKRAVRASTLAYADLTFSGRPINLIEFGARAVNPWNVKGRTRRRNGGGVSVQVKVAGGRKLIEGAFLTTIESGQNRGKQGAFRRLRLNEGGGRGGGNKIKFLPSVSIPQMVAARAINKALLQFAGERYGVNFRHELTFITGT